MTLLARAACLAVVGVLSVIAVGAQGKSTKAPAKWPGTLSFRCTTTLGDPNVLLAAECPASVTPVDAILGDGSDYALVPNGDQTLGAGAGLYGADLHVNLGNPALYAVQLDFTRPLQGHNGCSSYPAVPQECFPSAGEFLPLYTETGIQAHLTDVAGMDLGMSFEAMPLGATGFARVRVDFRDGLASNLLYRVRFNKIDYQGSDDMDVLRLDNEPCTWVLTSRGDDLAGVWTVKDVGRKKNVRLDFGLYSMPVEMTFRVFDAPGCPAKNW
jgi:hypothetical protein